MKLVYDLQLDREISARREYELSVESHLRRGLASELGARAAAEVAALSAGLAALRPHVELHVGPGLRRPPRWQHDPRVLSPGHVSPPTSPTS